MNFLKVAIPLLILFSLGPHYLFGPDEERISVLREMAAACRSENFKITHGNSARGERDGRLYGYVNITEMQDAFDCGTRDEAKAAFTQAVQNAVAEWLRKERFTALNKADIYIISTPDSADGATDQNAATDFSIAIQHGVLTFERGSEGQVSLVSNNFKWPKDENH